MGTNRTLALALVTLALTSSSLGGCGPDLAEDPEVAARGGAITEDNAAAWTALQGPRTLNGPPPEVTIKLNDNLSALTEIVVPAIAREYDLDDIALPKYPLLEDLTKADMGLLGDIAFACHDANTPIVLDIREMHVDLGIDADAASVVFDGTAATGSKVSFSADLPGFTFTGKLFLDWPATKDGILCALDNDFHVEIPFTLRGAELDAELAFAASGGGLTLDDFELTRIEIDEITLDNDTLDLLSNIGLAVADVAATAYQEVRDAVSKTDVEVDGVCDSTGSTPNLTSCLNAVAAGRLVDELSKQDGDFREALADMMTAPLPVPGRVAVGAAWFDVAPEIVDYAEHDPTDNAIVRATMVPTSTAPTAACAAGVRMPIPSGVSGGFSPQKDVDVVLPFDMIEAVAYQLARQGLFCLPPSVIGAGTATIEPAGAITVSNRSALTVLPGATIAVSQPGAATATATTTTTTTTTTTSTTTGAAGAISSAAYAPIGSSAPSPTPDLYTTHPMKLTFATPRTTPGGASPTPPTGAITLTVEIAWDLSFTCDNQIVLQVVDAKRVAMAGAVTLASQPVISASDPAVQGQVDARIATIPGRIPTAPLGPAIANLPGGVYLGMGAPNTSTREIQVGLSLRTTPRAACVSGGSQSTGSQGNDVVDTGGGGLPPPTITFTPWGATTGTTGGAGTIAGGTSGAAQTGGLTGGGSTGSNRAP